MNTEDFWRNDFGDTYHQRNRVDWRLRIPFWKMIIDTTGARSAYELGCGPGWNLSAIRRAFPDVECYGTDINQSAIDQAQSAGLNVWLGGRHGESDTGFDLTFTAGVLIHVAPEDLQATMLDLVNKSTRYVLVVEYESDVEEEVLYRGHEGKLWKRPYGKLYEGLGLRQILRVENAPGFDRCTAWLLEKK